MNYGTRVFTVLLVVSLLIFAVLTNTTVIYAQKVAINTQQTPSPSVPKLHSIKITSPTKGQEVPIDKELTCPRVYTPGNATITTTHCQVSVIANGVKPYQPATGIGPGGAADFSKWNFVPSSNYTTIKQGPNNKITAKYTCSNNPGLTSFNSVNITGVATTAKQQQGQQNVSNTTYKNTIPIQQTTHVVSNNTRSAILPYLISKNASQVTSTKFLGNSGTGNLSGMEYLGYPDAANASQVITTTFLGNGGTGKVSGKDSYLGYPDAANANQVTSLGNSGTGKVSGKDSYLGYPDAANANQVTSLGNSGTGKVSGKDSYLGYPDPANANQVTSLGNGGTGKVSGKDSYLGYPDAANANQVTSLGNGGTGKVSGKNSYLGYPDAANANQVTSLGNSGTGKVSGKDSYLGYPDAANANQVTSLGNGGTGKVSGMEYLGYPGHSSGSNNYNPVATGGRESRSSRDNVGPGSDDSSITTNHPHKAKSPRGVYQSPTSRSYIGGSGFDGPTQQSSTITMGNNTTIDALFPIENDNKNAPALARTGGGNIGIRV